MGRSKANSAYGGGHLKNISHQHLIFVKIDVFDVNTNVKKGPEPPNTDLFAKNKLEGVDLRRKMQGLRNSHLLYGPSW